MTTVINEYDLGDKPRLKSTFTADESAADPTAVALIVRDPSGDERSYLSSSGFSEQAGWDADANSPTLSDGTGTAGHYHPVTTAGTADLGNGDQVFAAGDYVYYNGEYWLHLPAPQADTLTKSSTGVYYLDLPVQEKGDWYFRFEGCGNVHAAGEKKFRVRGAKLR
jgi:hypothetical protein